MTLIQALDLIGTLVFAISGTLAGIQKRLDMFGALFTGFITALGGGTTRDLLLGNYPLAWVGHPYYILIILLGYTLAFTFTGWMLRLRNAFFLFDTIGLGVFTLLGIQKALILNVHPIIAVMMGTLSAVFGGALRDLFTTEIPHIFRKEIYAVACLAGGGLFFLLREMQIDIHYIEVTTVSFIIIVRMVAVRYKLGLPVPSQKEENLF
ncbi:MAG: hypothetical protein RIS47_1747 [Bacteroidota bacterium]|jgi:uncharacterized membrane protein YeiH